MYITLLIVLASVFANNYGKYIDLLPEEEKQEFLDRVVRRIMENVKTKVKTNTSTENLSDEELKKHNEFVKTIIQQESKQMTINKDDQIDNKDNFEENFDVKPLRTVQLEGDINADDVHLVPVDLTITDQRRSNRETSKENFTEKINTDVISSIQKRSVQTNVTNNDFQDNQPITEPEIESDTDEIKQTTIDTNGPLATEINDITISLAPMVNDNLQQEIKQENFTKVETHSELNQNIEEEIIPATETYINTTKIELNKTQIARNDDKAQAVKKNLIDKKIIHIKTIKEKSKNREVNKKIPRENNDGFLQNNKNMNLSEKSDQIEDNKPFEKVKGTSSSILTDEGTTETVTKTNPSYIQHEHTKMPKIFKHIKNNKTKNNAVNAKTIDKITNINSSPKSIPNILQENNNKKLAIKLLSDPKDSKTLSDLASKALKKVKEKYKNTRAEEYKSFLDSEIKPRTEKNKFPLKQYRIYEVGLPPLSDKVLRGDKSIEEQPHYVPVYEYSPNKAYFNPGNRYGPNAVEDGSIDKTYLLRDGNENNKTDEEASKVDGEEEIVGEDSETKSVLKGHVMKFALYHSHTKRPTINISTSTTEKNRKKHKKHPNHINNIDEDSDQIHFPDSYEHLHPFNNMKNGMKSHIKAVREILSNNGLFGEVHHRNREKYKEYYNDIKRRKKLLRSKNNKKVEFDFGTYKIIILKSDDAENKHRSTKKNFVKNKFGSLNTKRMKQENYTKLDTISKIIEVTDEKDVFINLKKLRDMNITLIRRSNDMKLRVYLKAVKDLIDDDSEALKQYDWLATTVQIQSALAKLKELLQRLQESKPIHPSDVQILKYMIFLHCLSLEIRDATKFGNQLRKKLLPKNKKKHNKLLKKKGLIDRVWLYLRAQLPDLTVQDGIAKLEEFIMKIENRLYDLHDALKNIAMITKYNSQNWYNNLRDLYLTTEQKHLQEILLHLSVSRLIELIEKSCENGLEEDFVKYMKTHRKEAKRTLDETLFVLRILDEIKYNKSR